MIGGTEQILSTTPQTSEPIARPALATEQPDGLAQSPERSQQLHQLMEALGLSNLENLPSELAILRKAMSQKVAAAIDPANPDFVPGDTNEKVALIKQAAIESKQAITTYKNDIKYGSGLMGKFRQFMSKPTAKIFAGATAAIGSVLSPVPLSLVAPALWAGGWRTMVEGIRQLTGDEGAKRRRLTEVHAKFSQNINQDLDLMVTANEVSPKERAVFIKEFVEGIYVREMQTLFTAENDLEEPMKARANWQNGAWKKTAYLALGLAMPMDIDGFPTAFGQMKGGDFKAHFVTLFKNFWDGDKSKWGSVGLLTGDNVLLKLGMAATNVAAGFGGYYLAERMIRKSEGKKVHLNDALPIERTLQPEASPVQPVAAVAARPALAGAPPRHTTAFGTTPSKTEPPQPYSSHKKDPGLVQPTVPPVAATGAPVPPPAPITPGATPPPTGPATQPDQPGAGPENLDPTNPEPDEIETPENSQEFSLNRFVTIKTQLDDPLTRDQGLIDLATLFEKLAKKSVSRTKLETVNRILREQVTLTITDRLGKSYKLTGLNLDPSAMTKHEALPLTKVEKDRLTNVYDDIRQLIRKSEESLEGLEQVAEGIVKIMVSTADTSRTELDTLAKSETFEGVFETLQFLLALSNDGMQSEDAFSIFKKARGVDSQRFDRQKSQLAIIKETIVVLRALTTEHAYRTDETLRNNREALNRRLSRLSQIELDITNRLNRKEILRGTLVDAETTKEIRNVFLEELVSPDLVKSVSLTLTKRP